MSSIAGMPATKHGLVYDDHHFKRDGKVESTPPTNMKSLYDYLPSDQVTAKRCVKAPCGKSASDAGLRSQVATSAKHIPSKLCLKGDNPTSHAACLKQQTRCLGVYTRVPGRDANGHPMWKHVDDDLCIGSAKVCGPVSKLLFAAGWPCHVLLTWQVMALLRRADMLHRNQLPSWRVALILRSPRAAVRSSVRHSGGWGSGVGGCSIYYVEGRQAGSMHAHSRPGQPMVDQVWLMCALPAPICPPPPDARLFA